MSGSCDITGVSPGYGVRNFRDENTLPILSDKFRSLNVQDRDQTRTYGYSSLASDCSSELEPKSTLDSLSLVDVEEILTEDEGSWLYSEKSSHNFSQVLGSKDKKITDEENDFGQVTQILGVLPLSTSNRDLSILDRQEVVEILTPNNNESEFPKLNSMNSSSNNNLLYGSGYIHVDINDVQNTAKLQEQSLRMSFSTPLVAKVVSLDIDERTNMEKSKRKLKDQFQGNTREQNNLQNNRRSIAPQMLSTRPKTMPANKFSSSSRERPQGVHTKFSSSDKPLKVNCQSSPNINRQFVGRPENARQIPSSHSTNISSYQKSLPNLSRQTLQTTTKSRSGDSTHRLDNSTQRKSLSIFSQPGPPMRTVSQPIVSSQMKTLKPQTQIKSSQKAPSQSSRNLLTNSSQTRPIVARSMTSQKNSLVTKEKQPQLSQRSSDTRNANKPLSNLSTSIKLSTPNRQLPSTSKPASTINRSINVASTGLRTSTATTKTNLITSTKPTPASALTSKSPSNVSSLKSRNVPSTLPFQSRLSTNATNLRTVNPRATSTPQRSEVISKSGLPNSVQRSSTPINALGKNVSLIGTNRPGSRQLPSPVRSNIPMRLTQAHHPQEDEGWKEGCF